MSRVKKILVASFVLAVGFGLAWPFRKSADAPSLPAESIVIPPAHTAGESFPPVGQEPERKQVAAQMASTGGSDASAFDLENHPSIAGHPATTEPSQLQTLRTDDTSPVTPELPPSMADARPAYETAPAAEPQPPAWPEEVVHVVQNGDTLEKLADRYLNDEGRAMELFDLNRDQLTNPHLLPIGAELRIPVPRTDEID